MRQIRRGIFETNSSSTHSLSIVSKDDFEKWQNGELYLDRWTDKFVKTPEEAKYPDEVQTYDQYFEDDYLECFEQSYTTKGGDEIVAFGKYGHD